MREASTSEFMHLIVSEHDPVLFQHWQMYPTPMDMPSVLRIMVMKLFVSNEQGQVADYVRELAMYQIEGSLFWKP